MRLGGPSFSDSWLAVCAPAAASASPILSARAAGSVLQRVGRSVDRGNCGRVRPEPVRAGASSRAVSSQARTSHSSSSTFDEETIFTVTTTSSYAAGNFDPTLGLFERGGDMLERAGPAFQTGSQPGFALLFDIDPFDFRYDDQL